MKKSIKSIYYCFSNNVIMHSTYSWLTSRKKIFIPQDDCFRSPQGWTLRLGQRATVKAIWAYLLLLFSLKDTYIYIYHYSICAFTILEYKSGTNNFACHVKYQLEIKLKINATWHTDIVLNYNKSINKFDLNLTRWWNNWLKTTIKLKLFVSFKRELWRKINFIKLIDKWQPIN